MGHLVGGRKCCIAAHSMLSPQRGKWSNVSQFARFVRGRQTWIPFEMMDLAASHESHCGIGRSTEQVARGSFCSASVSGIILPFFGYFCCGATPDSAALCHQQFAVLNF